VAFGSRYNACPHWLLLRDLASFTRHGFAGCREL